MSGTDVESSHLIRLPIFPLPNVVFFPQTTLPLHIFEPRYRQMVEDSLSGDRMIGMVLLQPGWQGSDNHIPRVFTIGSMGLITRHKVLAGGRYDIVLKGSRRYQIVRFVQEIPYRVALVRVLEESGSGPQEVSTELMLFFQELSEAAFPVLALDVLEKLDFATLVNSICSMINLSVYDKQVLLETHDLRSRAESLLAVLRKQIAQKRFTLRFEYLKPRDPGLN